MRNLRQDRTYSCFFYSHKTCQRVVLESPESANCQLFSSSCYHRIVKNLITTNDRWLEKLLSVDHPSMSFFFLLLSRQKNVTWGKRSYQQARRVAGQIPFPCWKLWWSNYSTKYDATQTLNFCTARRGGGAGKDLSVEKQKNVPPLPLGKFTIWPSHRNQLVRYPLKVVFIDLEAFYDVPLANFILLKKTFTKFLIELDYLTDF